VTRVVHGNLRLDFIDQHGARVTRVTVRGAEPVVTPRPTWRSAADGDRLVGRDNEIAVAGTATPGEPVEFYAACGYGRSALLRRLAAARGGVYERVGDRRVDDLRQRLFAQFYDVSAAFKPSAEQYEHLLGEISTLVLLDDADLGPARAREIVETLRGCAVVLGTSQRVLRGFGRSIALGGLPPAVALGVLSRELGRELSADEHADAVRLCTAVDHQPLHLRQAAALVATAGHDLRALADRAEADPFDLDRLSVESLTADQRRVLALLAFATGALLPASLVEVAANAIGTWDTLASLYRRGLVDQRDDRFGLPICHTDAYRAMLAGHLGLGEAARGMATWFLDRDPTGQEALSAADAAVTVITYAAERGEWGVVTELVVAADEVLGLAGRWEAWRQTLDLGIEGAQTTGDTSAEARLTHQLGTLEFAVDNLDAARRLWERALALREDLDDGDGAERTRENLALLVPPSVDSPSRVRRWWRRGRRAVTAASIVLALLVTVTPLVRALIGGPDAGASPAPAATSPATVATPSPAPAGPATAPPPPAPGGRPPVPGAPPGTPGQSRTLPTMRDIAVVPAAYRGACPATFTFAATITAPEQRVDVTYRWVRSDGYRTAPARVALGGNRPASSEVRHTWTVEGGTSGWAELELLSPAESVSEPAEFTLVCEQPVPTVTPTDTGVPTELPPQKTRSPDATSRGPVR
jgi:hypothetical protein